MFESQVSYLVVRCSVSVLNTNENSRDLQALPVEQSSRHVIWSSAFRRLQWQILLAVSDRLKPELRTSFISASKDANVFAKPHHETNGLLGVTLERSNSLTVQPR
jgi:hypothetical protein